MIGPQLSLSLLLFYCLFLSALESEMFEAQNQQESGAMSSGEQHHMLARLVITFQSPVCRTIMRIKLARVCTTSQDPTRAAWLFSHWSRINSEECECSLIRMTNCCCYSAKARDLSAMRHFPQLPQPIIRLTPWRVKFPRKLSHCWPKPVPRPS